MLKVFVQHGEEGLAVRINKIVSYFFLFFSFFFKQNRKKKKSNLTSFMPPDASKELSKPSSSTLFLSGKLPQHK
jgi:hypothetical protein